jgi:hypothetical protein
MKKKLIVPIAAMFVFVVILPSIAIANEVHGPDLTIVRIHNQRST